MKGNQHLEITLKGLESNGDVILTHDALDFADYVHLFLHTMKESRPITQSRTEAFIRTVKRFSENDSFSPLCKKASEASLYAIYNIYLDAREKEPYLIRRREKIVQDIKKDKEMRYLLGEVLGLTLIN